MKHNPVAELIAQELHRLYRAGEKALRTTDVAGERPYLQHDHGWAGCRKQDYFRKRAALLIKRAHVDNPTTLGEAEQTLAVTVLLRRLSAEGKLVVPVRPAYACGGLITSGRPVHVERTMSFPRVLFHGNSRMGKTAMVTELILKRLKPTDAELKAARDAKVREAMWGKR